MARDHHFKIGGLVWLWRYTRLRGTAAGWTIWPGSKKGWKKPRVLIDQRLTGRARLETEIHEAIHVCFPQMSEEAVVVAGRDISKVLWALGYRLTDAS